MRSELELPWRSVGRNDPCPCGTGRKFKACCAREPKIPLSARTRLLSFKLGQFARAEPRRSRIVGVASSACDPDAPNLIEQIRSLAQGSVIADFVIYDGGVAEDYLDRRGSLLPADERELVEALIDSPRALWEVVEVERGRGIVLRDMETSETIHAVEWTASRQAEVGEMTRALEAYLRQRELVWLDEAIPALGGITPREAVDDPTRREDLLSLLGELGDMNAAGANGFDAHRLRGLLGL